MKEARHYVERSYTSKDVKRPHNSSVRGPSTQLSYASTSERGQRSSSFMTRRIDMQSGPAGLQTSLILDAKYSMLRQRGQLKTEGGSFMRQ